MLFDSHCHLDDPRLLPHLERLLPEAEAAGVTGFLVPGVAPQGWNRIRALSAAYPQVFPAYGVHPMHAELLTPQAVSDLCQLATGACAIGEIGLDYLLPSPSRQVQQQAFRVQLRVAAEARLPVLLHCRKAFEDLLAIVREEGICGGVMHAFSGSLDSARSCLRLGLHISLAGSVTYANARRPLEVAAGIPLERLLLETDAPDLAPEPHRGSVNLPSYLLETATRVARIKGLPLEELGRTTTGNAARLFRLQGNAPLLSH
ncbi:TatD family hydrolase [Citrifermentans bremense]|uniref:TatD family hydrolase n=1 Tax=Citrifermentans bremense TaxID=60035 RepID=UPI00041FFC04|nr:TatD family hydrolase [Citrifermentans bremense]